MDAVGWKRIHPRKYVKEIRGVECVIEQNFRWPALGVWNIQIDGQKIQQDEITLLRAKKKALELVEIMYP